ncbi:hypothetical protein B0H14DRAFT_3526797 [Mycena olivaceomarginata]|nr:hypothetical protein B0H14DRAFT_3526797 [Mycena olivaceomarginata]
MSRHRGLGLHFESGANEDLMGAGRRQNKGWPNLGCLDVTKPRSLLVKPDEDDVRVGFPVDKDDGRVGFYGDNREVRMGFSGDKGNVQVAFCVDKDDGWMGFSGDKGDVLVGFRVDKDDGRANKDNVHKARRGSKLGCQAGDRMGTWRGAA